MGKWNHISSTRLLFRDFPFQFLLPFQWDLIFALTSSHIHIPHLYIGSRSPRFVYSLRTTKKIGYFTGDFVSSLRTVGSQVTGGLEIPAPCEKQSQIPLFWRVQSLILRVETNKYVIPAQPFLVKDNLKTKIYHLWRRKIIFKKRDM